VQEGTRKSIFKLGSERRESVKCITNISVWDTYCHDVHIWC